jgi:hypothetical protein
MLMLARGEPTVHGGLIFLSFAVVVAIAFFFHYRWARRRLEEWALENGIRILHHQYRILIRGPFNCFGKYSVFRVVVADERGGQKTGWVRLGGYFIGLWSRDSQVLWEWEKT